MNELSNLKPLKNESNTTKSEIEHRKILMATRIGAIKVEKRLLFKREPFYQ